MKSQLIEGEGITRYLYVRIDLRLASPAVDHHALWEARREQQFASRLLLRPAADRQHGVAVAVTRGLHDASDSLLGDREEGVWRSTRFDRIDRDPDVGV